MTEVEREMFGQMPQEEGGAVVEKFRLKSDSVKVEILSLGCIITTLETKDRDGKFSDIVLGFDTLEGYTRKHPFFGAVVGRVANRIAKGRFTVDGKEHQLFLNNGPNSLHGGARGFDKVLWSPQVLPNGVCFFRLSPDGEEGYPGDLKVWVTYTLCGGELTINYRAQTSKTTPISLTNHAYFNLAGQGSQDIYDHEISIEADSYLPVDDTKIPTGEVAAVQGTSFDLRQPVELGKHLQKFHLDGFDHNFCLQEVQTRCPVARTMEVHTTQPGIQFYTGNNLDGSLKGKDAAVYPKHSAFCLETQNWPDAINKMPELKKTQVTTSCGIRQGSPGTAGMQPTFPGVWGLHQKTPVGSCCIIPTGPDFSKRRTCSLRQLPHFPNALLRPGEEYNHTTWLLFNAS
ncbi:galactose mutarotase isoform X2 [Cuculus canorus]|uniref:galactose mutarotase isoform X2 n=1 Tax=Cuculus canorus TaxID=55661 RepID=UPI0023AABD91|nr:galactose mutarotase isoform X2 [Cuculus canorus]